MSTPLTNRVSARGVRAFVRSFMHGMVMSVGVSMRVRM